MEFRLKPAPSLRGKRSTKGMMLEFFVVLCVVWIYSIVFNFIAVGPKNGLSAILIGVVAIASSFACDAITYLLTKNKKYKFFEHLVHSYSYVTGLILALALPVNTSLYAVVIASLFGTVIGKLVFGGFGHNIVNPAGLGRIFAVLSFNLGSTIESVVDGTAGATVTSKIDWLTGYVPSQFNMKDLFFGNYMGAMGEACTILLLICGLYLAIRKIIDYRLTVSYLLGTFIISFVLAFVLKVNYALTYAITHMLVGGLMFGAVFMVTDPVTTPSSQLGKIIYGLGCAMLTVLFRVCGSMPEGVVFSIVLMNLFTPIIDIAIKGNNKDKIWKRWLVVVIGLILAIGVNIAFALLKI